MIRIDAIWLATEPMDMRAGTDTALARVVAVFGAAQPHCAYLFATHTAPGCAAATKHQRPDPSVLPKGTDLWGHSQTQLDAISLELNMRHRKRFNLKFLIEIMSEMMQKAMAMWHYPPTLIQ